MCLLCARTYSVSRQLCSPACVPRRPTPPFPAGGQKVKLVLGAAMWQQPHILVLDEPTNYLDRESLGAMASAIKVRGQLGAAAALG